MRPDDTADAVDRDAFDGEAAAAFGPDASGAEPVTLGLEVADDDGFEPEFGEPDVPYGHEFRNDELDDEVIDPVDEETEDDLEIALLQELGIDLDAPDEVEVDFVEPAFAGLTLVGGLHDEDPIDEEVAA